MLSRNLPWKLSALQHGKAASACIDSSSEILQKGAGLHKLGIGLQTHAASHRAKTESVYA